MPQGEDFYISFDDMREEGWAHWPSFLSGKHAPPGGEAARTVPPSS